MPPVQHGLRNARDLHACIALPRRSTSAAHEQRFCLLNTQCSAADRSARRQLSDLRSDDCETLRDQSEPRLRTHCSEVDGSTAILS